MKNISVLIVAVLSISIAQAQLTLTPFVNAVNKVTDITNVGDDRLFIVEQEGRIRISDLSGNLLPAPFLSITSKVNDNTSEQGLLGLAFSPTYSSDGRFYVNYTNLTGTTVVSRFQVTSGNPDLADSLNEEILLTVAQPYPNHNGGSMHFGPDGYLYIALGDGGAGGDPGNRAQNKHH
jgi:glucose/arabinose dehydrogenase